MQQVKGGCSVEGEKAETPHRIVFLYLTVLHLFYDVTKYSSCKYILQSAFFETLEIS